MAASFLPATGCSRPEVAVVGSGAAGLMAALAASESAQVTLITDRVLGKSNTALAQGGLQFPFPNAASVESFAEDMRKSARVPLDSGLLSRFVNEARDTILHLAELGMVFDEDANGEWKRKTAGGLSEARIISVGDRIGAALMRVLLRNVRARSIRLMEWTRVVDLRPLHDTGIELCLEHAERGSFSERFASAVLATGGQTYSHAHSIGEPTTNPENTNASMHDILRRLGVEQAHPGFYQYQPFGLIIDAPFRAPGKAFPESILTFPVRILDSRGQVLKERDERPDRLTLCQRMFDAEAAGHAFSTSCGRRGFHLCLHELPASLLDEHFPSAMQYLRKQGYHGGPAMIRPFLHYQLGGFRIDAECRSSLPGLFLAGEITGGLHGKNRLMGNGLTDSLVHGRRAGFSAAKHARAQHSRKHPA